jgi:SNF2 family DNA or RNA helicase
MTKLNYEDLDKDQLNLIDRLYGFDQTLVYATMGSGKTVCYLTAIDELLRDKVVKRALIIAPLNPAKHVWSSEHKQWSHLEHLDIVLALGVPEHRIRAIDSSADIVVINIENLAWFLDLYKNKIPFDAMCIDETSKFGSTGNTTVKKLRHATKSFKHVVGLTGTPVHEGFVKLFSQVLVLDGGKRLGTNKQKFLDRYFYATDYEQHNWDLRAGMDTELLNCLNDLIYAMPSYTNTLPELIEENTRIDLDDYSMSCYKYLAKNSILELSFAREIVAESAAVLSGKLEQLANGFLYQTIHDEKIVHYFSERKVTAFVRYLKYFKRPLLVFYQFQADKERLSKAMESINITYSTMDSKTGMSDFLANKVQVLLLHPKSAGHGLNLHTGGARDILCYSPIWSNDQYKQLVGRLWRRGVTGSVTVTRLVARGTIDETKLARVDTKDEHDAAFKAHIKSL